VRILAAMKLINPIARLETMEAEVGTRQALAAKLGLSASYLSDVMNGRRDVNQKLLKRIGLKSVVIEGRAK